MSLDSIPSLTDIYQSGWEETLEWFKGSIQDRGDFRQLQEIIRKDTTINSNERQSRLEAIHSIFFEY